MGRKWLWLVGGRYFPNISQFVGSDSWVIPPPPTGWINTKPINLGMTGPFVSILLCKQINYHSISQTLCLGSMCTSTYKNAWVEFAQLRDLTKVMLNIKVNNTKDHVSYCKIYHLKRACIYGLLAFHPFHLIQKRPFLVCFFVHPIQ